jgi:hypothetical protein
LKVSSVPKAVIRGALFNYLIGAGKDRLRDCEAQRLAFVRLTTISNRLV